MKKVFTNFFCLLVAMAIAFSACEGPEGDVGPQGSQGDKGDKGDQGDPGDDGADYPSDVQLQNYSITPALLKKLGGFEATEVFSLISGEVKLTASPSNTFGGSADWAGLLKLTDGCALVVNHEDNYSESCVTFRPDF